MTPGTEAQLSEQRWRNEEWSSQGLRSAPHGARFLYEADVLPFLREPYPHGQVSGVERIYPDDLFGAVPGSVTRAAQGDNERRKLPCVVCWVCGRLRVARTHLGAHCPA